MKHYHVRNGKAVSLKVFGVVDIEAGININAIDKYESIALIYSLTVLKLTTQDAYPIYELLLKHNADYTLKNDEGKSALD